MVGIETSKSTIDIRTAEAIQATRSAFDKIENVAKFLSNNPVTNGVDPLVATYGYNEDEAYLIRFVFESFYALRANNQSIFDTARKLTGLE